jgi:uncharacterized membrane protein
VLRSRWLALGCAGLAGAVAAPASILAMFVAAYGANHANPPPSNVRALATFIGAFVLPPLVAVGAVVLLAGGHRRRAALVGMAVFLALLTAVFGATLLFSPGVPPLPISD